MGGASAGRLGGIGAVAGAAGLGAGRDSSDAAGGGSGVMMLTGGIDAAEGKSNFSPAGRCSFGCSVEAAEGAGAAETACGFSAGADQESA